ncbi:MAG: TlpA family protein disulfide reductase [Lysobacterales bacterium]
MNMLRYLSKYGLQVLVAVLALGTLLLVNNQRGTSPAPPKPQFGQSRHASSPNALGESVSLADFSGQYIWVDYAAEWCAACVPQSGTIRSLDGRVTENVAFVTVMASEIGGYGHPATQETAARWARSLSLQPSRVLATDFSAMTLPQHALFSPSGEQLMRHTGQLSAQQIRQSLSSHME